LRFNLWLFLLIITCTANWRFAQTSVEELTGDRHPPVSDGCDEAANHLLLTDIPLRQRYAKPDFPGFFAEMMLLKTIRVICPAPGRGYNCWQGALAGSEIAIDQGEALAARVEGGRDRTQISCRKRRTGF